MSQKILNTTPFPTLIVNQHIIMISEGSCDTEDQSNDAENSALPSQEYIIFESILK